MNKGYDRPTVPLEEVDPNRDQNLRNITAMKPHTKFDSNRAGTLRDDLMFEPLFSGAIAMSSKNCRL